MKSPSRIVACVKWGNKYGPEEVNRLFHMVKRNLTVEFRFVCLTDSANGLASGVEAIPIPVEGLDGWWNKLLLFKPGVFDENSRVLYFDLDVVIVDRIDCLFDSNEPIKICKGFGGAGGFNSSIFVFAPKACYDLYEKFALKSEEVVGELKGDQDWIYLNRPGAMTFQPGIIRSFKTETNSLALPYLNSVRCFVPRRLFKMLRKLRPLKFQKASAPKGAAVIVFHGKPDPVDVSEGFYRGYRQAPYITKAWQD